MATATAILPHYVTPVTVPSADTSNSSGWIISTFTKAPNGQELSQNALYSSFHNLPASVQDSANPDAFMTWLTQHGYTMWTTLQPGSRFWEFQLIEGGWLLALSAALVGVTAWLTHRRSA